ncbi:hypothetical protein ACQEV4_25145 [Streptomyces shenzhenensis]
MGRNTLLLQAGGEGVREASGKAGDHEGEEHADPISAAKIQ